MSIPLKSLLRRQGDCNGGECFGSGGSSTSDSTIPTSSADPGTDTDSDFWPNSDAGYVIRYVILAAIVVFVILWIILGVWHANRRLKRGQQPLWYHRWLLPPHRRYPHGRQQQQWPQYGHYDPTTGMYHQGQAYPMHNWQGGEHAPPPPVYSHDSPPGYTPPPGPPPGREPKGDDAATSTVTPIAGEPTAQASGAVPHAPPPSHPNTTTQ